MAGRLRDRPDPHHPNALTIAPGTVPAILAPGSAAMRLTTERHGWSSCCKGTRHIVSFMAAARSCDALVEGVSPPASVA
jgi:hypothetical protein